MAVATPSRKLTYEDYLLLPEDGRRYEIIDGELFVTPAPSRKHQTVAYNLVLRIGNHLADHNTGRLFFAPFDVVLSEHDVVEPDLLFISRERNAILTQKNVQGPPDLAVEILSESTRKRDKVLKRKRYEQFGIAEYWIIDPELESVEIHRRVGNAFELVAELTSGTGGMLTSPLFPGLAIDVRDVFAEP